MILRRRLATRRQAGPRGARTAARSAVRTAPARATPVRTAAAAGATLLAACGGHHVASRAPAAAPGSSTPVSTTGPTTTVRPAPPPTAPLTGLLQPDVRQRRAVAVVVKIDNVDAARPQTGITEADVVYEEMVEGGLTRLAAVYQSSYPGAAGPVRSGRLTDAAIADDLNHPVLVYSGANAVFLPILRSQPVTDVDGESHGGLYYRVGYKPEPHNLFTSVKAAAGLSTTHAPPPALWDFRPAAAPFTGAGLAPAGHLSISFPATSVTWSYDGASRLWMRDQNGGRDVGSRGTRIGASNVIVQFVRYVSSGMATGEGVAPVPIPKGELVGSGAAWYLSGGRVVRGTWSRTGTRATTEFKDAAGYPVRLAPGRTWVELVPVGSATTVLP